jgi:peptidoglycan/xylan/chitin deacetylase (PgdA/CDA1 family)
MIYGILLKEIQIKIDRIKCRLVDEMQDVAIMYHYVRNRNGWNGIFPLEPKLFEEQIDALSKHYEIVAPEDLGRKSSKPKCVLTFDDGTKDQYSVAFDILNRKGLPGYFTVMSGPLVHQNIPVFNLVHVVLSMFTDEEIWAGLNKTFELKDIEENSSVIYSYEKDLLRRYNKYALNFLLSENESRSFLEQKVISKYGTKQNFINQFYISTEEFLKMKHAGMTLGVHCVDHRPYSGNAMDFYHKEIEPCAEFMDKELGVKPQWYTPAFGGGEKYQSMVKDLEPILIEKGFKGGFTTIPGKNEGLSTFWLNRYDCAKVPPVSKEYLGEIY